MTTIIPLRDRQAHLPVQGRIRIGIQSDGRPKAIDTFRFTSSDEESITQLAVLYGGQVRVWNEQFEVISEASTINVVLPPDPLGNTPRYELWSAGGRQRACDGEECIVAGEDDYEAVPCICDRKQVLECKLQTRLSVILPEVNFNGVWMFASGGFNVAEQIPAMVQIVLMSQARGLIRAQLVNEAFTKKTPKGTRHYRVVALRPNAPFEELESGQPKMLALPKALDDDVIEAELVETTSVLDLTADQMGALSLRASSGRTADHFALNDEEDERLNKALTALEEGTVYFAGIKADGQADLRSTKEQ